MRVGSEISYKTFIWLIVDHWEPVGNSNSSIGNAKEYHTVNALCIDPVGQAHSAYGLEVQQQILAGELSGKIGDLGYTNLFDYQAPKAMGYEYNWPRLKIDFALNGSVF